MDLFTQIKMAVSVKEAAEYYGLEVNRGSMVCCPFHADRTPSMKLNEDYFYCFGCGATGDVIDLAARLFNLSSYDAAKKLAYDFGIAPDKPPTAADQLRQVHRDRPRQNGFGAQGQAELSGLDVCPPAGILQRRPASAI